MSGSVVEGKNKNVHLADILPFRVSEAAAGAPLRILGVAMVAGLFVILMFTRLRSCKL